MCLLLLALDRIPGKPWLLLGNRDEFHARPTAAAQAWSDDPQIIGGRDLQAGGSWLALHRNARYAAVTNVRRAAPQTATRSRGALVGEFLATATTPADYAAAIARRSNDYGPFNLIVGDAFAAWFVSSIDAMPRRLEPGIHAFSNGSRDDEWPKMRRLREGFAALVQARSVSEPGADRLDSRAVADAWQDLLLDRTQPDDRDLPDTRVGLVLERQLAPIFIAGETYGTRASTLAYAVTDGGVVLHERRFGPNGVALGESTLAL
jgi:uncharacterized protein with NRDE domain